MALSVFVVEDEPRFRQIFVEAIINDKDLQLAGQADDLPQAFELLPRTKPDVLLVDIGLPSGSGIHLIRWVKDKQPNCDVMVITVFADERHVFESIEAGATGYLLKSSKDVDIANQIRTLHEGGSPISPAIARRLMLHFKMAAHDSRQTTPAMSSLLSEQEQFVLTMSAKGYSYAEIAKLMHLSSRTVETYVKRIYSKLQVHSKAEAVYEGRKLGLLKD